MNRAKLWSIKVIKVGTHALKRRKKTHKNVGVKINKIAN